MWRGWLTLSLLPLALAVPAEEPQAERVALALNTGGHTAAVCGLTFGLLGRRLMTAGTDNSVRVWNVATGEPETVFRLPAPDQQDRTGTAGVQGLALSPKGRQLAVAYQGGDQGQSEVLLWDLFRPGAVQTLKGLGKYITLVAFAPDGKTLAVGAERVIVVWDLEAGKERLRFQANEERKSAVVDLAFAPDGTTLAAVSFLGPLRLWDLKTGKERANPPGSYDAGLAWSRDGQRLACPQRGKGIALLRPDGTLEAEVPCKRPTGRLGLAFFPDGTRLLAGGTVLELPGGKEVAHCAANLGPVRYAALAADGKTAVAAGDQGEQLVLWDPADGRVLHDLGGGGQSPAQVAWAKDGRGIAWRAAEAAGPGGRRGAGWQRFDFAGGQLGKAAPADLQLAQHKRGDLTLVRVEARVAVKRGMETVHDLRPGRPERIPHSFTFLGDPWAITGGSFGLDLYDLTTGKRQPRDFKNAGVIRSIAPSPDGKYFVTCSYDLVLKVWAPDRDQPLLSLFANGEDWIAWTPEGYYDATPGGERLMGWQVTPPGTLLSTFHPAARFRKSLYRPEVVRKVLEAGSTAAALKLAGKGGAAVEVSKVLPPAVAITAPAAGATLAAGTTVVKATATGRGGHPITALQLLVDDRPYEGERGVRAVTGRDVVQEKEWAVTLSPGPHRLAVLATSAVSTGRSETVEVTYTPAAAPKADNRPALHVLAIGINEYDHGIPKLACAVADARELAGCFQTHSKALFRDVRAHLLLDRAATREGVLKALAAVKQGMKEQDVLVISYAGHGYGDRDFQFFLLTQDADLDKLKETSVSNADLKRELADMPCGRVLLVLDACHSGNAGGVRPDTAAALANLERTLTDDDCGVVVMTAAKGTEQSLEAEGHGFFTRALIEGLSGKADYNKDGLIHLTELDLHTFDQVRAWTKDRQHPSLGKPPTITSFPLAKP